MRIIGRSLVDINQPIRHYAGVVLGGRQSTFLSIGCCTYGLLSARMLFMILPWWTEDAGQVCVCATNTGVMAFDAFATQFLCVTPITGSANLCRLIHLYKLTWRRRRPSRLEYSEVVEREE